MTGTISGKRRGTRGQRGTTPLEGCPLVPAVPAVIGDTVFHHDLTGTFTPAIADAIRDAWLCARDRTDPHPIRELYRANPHPGFRGALAELMKGHSA